MVKRQVYPNASQVTAVHVANGAEDQFEEAVASDYHHRHAARAAWEEFDEGGQRYADLPEFARSPGSKVVPIEAKLGDAETIII